MSQARMTSYYERGKEDGYSDGYRAAEHLAGSMADVVLELHRRLEAFMPNSGHATEDELRSHLAHVYGELSRLVGETVDASAPLAQDLTAGVDAHGAKPEVNVRITDVPRNLPPGTYHGTVRDVVPVTNGYYSVLARFQADRPQPEDDEEE